MKKQKIVLFDIDYTLFDTDSFKKTNLQKHSVYDEVYDVLNQVSKKARLGIFSEGELEFQKEKLTKTKIKQYFKQKHTHIVEEKDTKLAEILLRYKDNRLFLVDDKLTILYKAKKLMPSIFTIWIKRGIYAKSQKPIDNFSPDATIENLKQVVTIIGSGSN